jgi:hypothetical protein
MKLRVVNFLNIILQIVLQLNDWTEKEDSFFIEIKFFLWPQISVRVKYFRNGSIITLLALFLTPL